MFKKIVECIIPKDYGVARLAFILALVVLAYTLSPLAALDVTTGTVTTARVGRLDLVASGVEYEVDIVEVRSYSWTCAADGEAVFTIEEISGDLLRVVTNPTDGPTDDWDLTLIDQDGLDVLSGLGANRDTLNSENIVPFLTDTTGTRPMPTSGDLTVNVTNAGNAKSGVIRIFFRR